MQEGPQKMARTSEKIRVTGSIHVGAKEKNIKPTSGKTTFRKKAKRFSLQGYIQLAIGPFHPLPQKGFTPWQTAWAYTLVNPIGRSARSFE